MAVRERKAGEFCWINVLTPEPAAARRFFGEFLSWEFVEIEGMGGHRIRVDGRDIGGMWDLAAPNMPAGLLPGIGVMVRADDADAIAMRINALGGRASAAHDIGPQGRMVDGHDPNGANIDVWQPYASVGMTADPSRHGVPSWFETLTTDVGKATAFYEALNERGTAMVFTAVTMTIGVGTWAMSALKFQADMGILLAFMFFLNMLGALFLLPALAAFLLEPPRTGPAAGQRAPQ